MWAAGSTLVHDKHTASHTCTNLNSVRTSTLHHGCSSRQSRMVPLMCCIAAALAGPNFSLFFSCSVPVADWLACGRGVSVLRASQSTGWHVGWHQIARIQPDSTKYTHTSLNCIQNRVLIHTYHYLVSYPVYTCSPTVTAAGIVRLALHTACFPYHHYGSHCSAPCLYLPQSAAVEPCSSCTASITR